MLKHGIKIRYIPSVCLYHRILPEKLICIRPAFRKLTRAHKPHRHYYETGVQALPTPRKRLIGHYHPANTCADPPILYPPVGDNNKLTKGDARCGVQQEYINR